MSSTVVVQPCPERLPALWRVLLFQTFFWGWFAVYQWVLWPRLDAWRSAVRPELGWIGLFLDFTWIKAALTLVLLVWAARCLDRRPLRDYGFRFDRRALGLLLAAFLLGIVVHALPPGVGWALGGASLSEVLYVKHQPGGEGVWFGVAILPAFVNVALTGFWEEATFRAHPIKNLAEDDRFQRDGWRWKFWSIVLPTAVYFAVAHVASPVPASGYSILFRCCTGIVLASMYYATGELALPMGFHAGGNFAVNSLIQVGLEANTCFFRLADTTRGGGNYFVLLWLMAVTAAAVLWAWRHTRRPEHNSPLRK